MSSGNRQNRQAPFRVRPAAVAVIVLVLGVFIGALVIGGVAGAAMIGALAVIGGSLLALRWTAIDARVRMIRLVAVALTVVVAVTVLLRR